MDYRLWTISYPHSGIVFAVHSGNGRYETVVSTLIFRFASCDELW